jgi:hypothetical protein
MLPLALDETYIVHVETSVFYSDIGIWNDLTIFEFKSPLGKSEPLPFSLFSIPIKHVITVFLGI